MSDTTPAFNRNIVGTFSTVLEYAEEGDVIGFYHKMELRTTNYGPQYEGEYYYAAVLFSSPNQKILSRFYLGEPEWVEPLPGTKVVPVAGTTILPDDHHITLIDQDGKKIPCSEIGRALLFKNRLPNLPQEFFWLHN